MTKQNGTITWNENPKTGKGELTLRLDDDSLIVIEDEDPISASTDSHAVAGLFSFQGVSYETVESDREYIHLGGITL